MVRRSVFLAAILVLCLTTGTWGAGARATGVNTYTVTNTNDSGPGSLRQAIMDANRRVGPDTIVFNIPDTDPGHDAQKGVWIIELVSEYPVIDRGDLIIDGNSQKGFVGRDANPSGPEIVLDGTNAGVNAIGLRLRSSDNEIAGLCIGGFSGFLSEGAILIEGNRNVIRGCYIGVDPTGQKAHSNHVGITIRTGSQETTVGGVTEDDRNVISGSTGTINGFGIRITGADTNNTEVIGNYIGTNISGTVAIANQMGGVSVEMGARYATIGGYEPGEGNLISGNKGHGVLVRGNETRSVDIWGNIIGMNASGDYELGNGDSGVAIIGGASHVAVGGRRSGKGNLISANYRNGVKIANTGTGNNTVESNLIGTDITGLSNWGNQLAGVVIEDGASQNIIGGDTVVGNVIADNGWQGTTDVNSCGVVLIGVSENYVQGNFIGTDATGLAVLGNLQHGVYIGQRATDNIIGSETNPVYGNVISANGAAGVRIDGLGTTGNVVANNAVGTDRDGRMDLGNGAAGVQIRGGATDNIIGPHNMIHNNNSSGVHVHQGSTVGNRITRNSISGNGAKPIEIDWSPYSDPPHPEITDGEKTWVSGTAPAGSTVEVFSDPAEEGFRYEGTVQAGGDGTFYLELPGPMFGRFASASATDSAGTTSEFSDPYEVDPLWIKTYLPMMANG